MADHAARARERAAHAAGQRWTAATLRARVRAGERSGLRCFGPCGGRPRHVCSGHAEHVPTCSFCACRCDGTGRAPLMRGIELAAYCGDAAARELASPRVPRSASHKRRACESCNDMGCLVELDGPTPCECSAPDAAPFDDWLRWLGRWGREVLVRAAVEAARAPLGDLLGERGWWLDDYRRDHGKRPDHALGDGLCHIGWRERPRAEWEPIELAVSAIEAAEEWLRDPSDARREQAMLEARVLHATVDSDPLRRLAALAASAPSKSLRALEIDLPISAELAAGAFDCYGDGEQRVRAAICRALIPVALGEPA